MEFLKKTFSWTMLLALTLSMSLASCSSDDDDDISSSIVGKWAYSDEPDSGIMFTQDGKLIFWEDGYEDFDGYYRQSGNKLFFECEEDGDTYIEEYTIIKLTENTLIIGGYDEDEYEEMEFIRVN